MKSNPTLIRRKISIKKWSESISGKEVFLGVKKFSAEGNGGGP